MSFQRHKQNRPENLLSRGRFCRASLAPCSDLAAVTLHPCEFFLRRLVQMAGHIVVSYPDAGTVGKIGFSPCLGPVAVAVLADDVGTGSLLCAARGDTSSYNHDY